MQILVNLILSAIVVLVAAYIVPGVVVPTFVSALATAVVLALLNATVKPILLFFTLPINILTLGLFTIVINIIILYLAAALVPGFEIESFFSALLFSVAVSLIGSIIQLAT